MIKSCIKYYLLIWRTGLALPFHKHHSTLLLYLTILGKCMITNHFCLPCRRLMMRPTNGRSSCIRRSAARRTATLTILWTCPSHVYWQWLRFSMVSIWWSTQEPPWKCSGRRWCPQVASVLSWHASEWCLYTATPGKMVQMGYCRRGSIGLARCTHLEFFISSTTVRNCIHNFWSHVISFTLFTKS